MNIVSKNSSLYKVICLFVQIVLLFADSRAEAVPLLLDKKDMLDYCSRNHLLLPHKEFLTSFLLESKNCLLFAALLPIIIAQRVPSFAEKH
nr:MAG TPA: hypothetical protein [Caudoviricetes sp.]